TESEFGLISDEFLGYNFEVAYNPGASLNCYFFGHIADRESFQRARQSGGTLSTNPLDDWELLLDEDNTTWGFGVTSDNGGPWRYDVSAYYSESDGNADFTTPPGGRDAVDFNNYEDIELLGVDLQVDYSLGDNSALGFRYLYEDYTINSFNLQGLQNFLPSTLLLVPSFGDYQANVFGLSLKIKI
ncbi:MAG: MtrB/PioB family outer membrane beta-barrel protein, partial [Thermoanaerobaculia bacterium]